MKKSFKPEKNLKSADQIAVEIKQEKIVINARKLILPILKKNNLTVEHSKQVCDVLAVVLQQGQFNLAQKHKVADLKLLEEITDQYPEYASIKEIVTAINDMSTTDGINVLQWMLAKINKVIEDENKKRSFDDLNLDF